MCTEQQTTFDSIFFSSHTNEPPISSESTAEGTNTYTELKEPNVYSVKTSSSFTYETIYDEPITTETNNDEYFPSASIDWSTDYYPKEESSIIDDVAGEAEKSFFGSFSQNSLSGEDTSEGEHFTWNLQINQDKEPHKKNDSLDVGEPDSLESSPSSEENVSDEDLNDDDEKLFQNERCLSRMEFLPPDNDNVPLSVNESYQESRGTTLDVSKQMSCGLSTDEEDQKVVELSHTEIAQTESSSDDDEMKSMHLKVTDAMDDVTGALDTCAILEERLKQIERDIDSAPQVDVELTVEDELVNRRLDSSDSENCKIEKQAGLEEPGYPHTLHYYGKDDTNDEPVHGYSFDRTETVDSNLLSEDDIQDADTDYVLADPPRMVRERSFYHHIPFDADVSSEENDEPSIRSNNDQNGNQSDEDIKESDLCTSIDVPKEEDEPRISDTHTSDAIGFGFGAFSTYSEEPIASYTCTDEVCTYQQTDYLSNFDEKEDREKDVEDEKGFQFDEFESEDAEKDIYETADNSDLYRNNDTTFTTEDLQSYEFACHALDVDREKDVEDTKELPIGEHIADLDLNVTDTMEHISETIEKHTSIIERLDNMQQNVDSDIENMLEQLRKIQEVKDCIDSELMPQVGDEAPQVVEDEIRDVDSKDMDEKEQERLECEELSPEEEREEVFQVYYEEMPTIDFNESCEIECQGISKSETDDVLVTGEPQLNQEAQIQDEEYRQLDLEEVPEEEEGYIPEIKAEDLSQIYDETFPRFDDEGFPPFGNQKLTQLEKEKLLSLNNEEFSSFSNEEFPSLNNEEFPSFSNEEFPSFNEEYPPLINEEFPLLNNEELPSLTNEEFPPLSNEELPEVLSKLEVKEWPQIDGEELSQIDNEELAQFDNYELPPLENEELPRVENEDLPQIESEGLPEIYSEEISTVDEFSFSTDSITVSSNEDDSRVSTDFQITFDMDVCEPTKICVDVDLPENDNDVLTGILLKGNENVDIDITQATVLVDSSTDLFSSSRLDETLSENYEDERSEEYKTEPLSYKDISGSGDESSSGSSSSSDKESIEVSNNELFMDSSNVDISIESVDVIFVTEEEKKSSDEYSSDEDGIISDESSDEEEKEEGKEKKEGIFSVEVTYETEHAIEKQNLLEVESDEEDEGKNLEEAEEYREDYTKYTFTFEEDLNATDKRCFGSEIEIEQPKDSIEMLSIESSEELDETQVTQLAEALEPSIEYKFDLYHDDVMKYGSEVAGDGIGDITPELDYEDCSAAYEARRKLGN